MLVALAVTLGTLVTQGTTLGRLARRLAVRPPDAREDAIEQAMILQRAGAAGLRAARAAARQGDEDALATLAGDVERRVNVVWERLGRPNTEVGPPAAANRRLREAALAGERAEVLKIRDEGHADQAIVSEVLAWMDVEEASLGLIRTKVSAIEAAGAPAFRVPTRIEPCRHLRDAPACVLPLSGECLECVAEGTRPSTCGSASPADTWLLQLLGRPPRRSPLPRDRPPGHALVRAGRDVAVVLRGRPHLRLDASTRHVGYPERVGRVRGRRG